MNLPKDPMMLLSYVNTKLRDQYPSLEALCEDLSVEQENLCQSLSAIDYSYDPKLNRFV